MLTLYKTAVCRQMIAFWFLPATTYFCSPTRCHRDGCVEPEETFEVLNEVVLSRGANPYLSKIEVRAREEEPGESSAVCACTAQRRRYT